MSDLLERTREAYLEAWRVHTIAAGGEIVESDSLMTCFTGSPAGPFNPTLALAHGFSERIAAAERAYAERGIDFGFVVDERFFDEADAYAAAEGFNASLTRPSMALHPIEAIEAIDADIRLVDGAAELEAHVLTQEAGFGTAAAHIRPFMPPSVLGHRDEVYLIAYVDGFPAATSMLVRTGREAGIYAVSTHPDHRRRGLGRAVTAAAVREAVKLGCDLSYLQASEMGFGVYEAMGFRTVEMQRIFTRAAPGPES